MVSKNKIFCIGLNKTGTTTIEKVLQEFNFTLGNQSEGEFLIHDWYKRDFKKIIRFCKRADAFQDIPFSLPFTFMFLELYFPKAKFILTIRDDAEQWYNSLTHFHANLWGNGKEIPTITQLKQAKYRYIGFAYDANKMMFNTPIEEPYHKETLINFYSTHNTSVIEYFRSKPHKLLVINVANKTDYLKLCDFVDKEPIGDDFPWENKTNRI